MIIFPGFGGPSIPPPAPLPPPPPPPPEKTDPEVEEAKRNLKASVAKRRGRAGSQLTGTNVSGGSVLRASATDDSNEVLG